MKRGGTWIVGVGWALAVVAPLFGCGGEDAPPPPPPPTPSVCGNGVVEAPEQCDDDDTVGDLACDRWCAVTCGNGVVDDGEVCDPATDAGCPDAVSCDDGDACTEDVLADSACQTTCLHVPLASATCCDSGSSAGTATCGETAYAYRLTSFKLRDPHAFIQLSVCADITDVGLLAINQQYDESLVTDGDADGLLDYSPVVVLGAAPMPGGGPLEMHFNFANCAADGSHCAPTALDVTAAASITAGGGSEACLEIAEETVHGYTPALVTPTPACITSEPTTASFTLGGIPLVLEDTQISATLVGDPAQGMINGVIRGFLTEATADATVIPQSLPLVGGKRLSFMLPGGTPPNGKNCALHDDRDVRNGTSGWWFYVNFTATRVAWNAAN